MYFLDIGTGIAKEKKGVYGQLREASQHIDDREFVVQK